MTKRVLINNQAVPEYQTKVSFMTQEAIVAQSPAWAKWLFRCVAIITTVVVFYVAGTNLITENHKVEVMLGLKALDMLTLGFSKMFGIVIK
jgi:hypothetical protein